jgi:pyruvate dehydrogenase kinase 2/3/4
MIRRGKSVALNIVKFHKNPLRKFSLARILTRNSEKSFVDQVPIFAEKSQTPLNMSVLLKLSGVEFAKFLHEELPVRLARRVIELEDLPYGLSEMGSIKKVTSWYLDTFEELRSLESPSSDDDAQKFKLILENVLTRHNNVVPAVAQGLIELKEKLGEKEAKIVDNCPFLTDFLDRFFLARIGIRILIGQYVASFNDRPGFIGLFEKECRVKDVVELAYDDAAMLCSRNYGDCPDLKFTGKNDLTLTYIPGHIHHVLFELIKNSMRAIVENPKYKNGDFPQIEICLAEGEDDIGIKLSDQGGGISRKDMSKIFQYSFTTAKAPTYGVTENSPKPQLAGLTHIPMAGFGYGLPLSRLYSHVFGGDLLMLSMHGYGTDAYLYLSKLHQSTEIVPR